MEDISTPVILPTWRMDGVSCRREAALEQRSEDPVAAAPRFRDQGDKEAAARGSGREASEMDVRTSEQRVPRSECWSMPTDADRPRDRKTGNRPSGMARMAGSGLPE